MNYLFLNSIEIAFCRGSKGFIAINNEGSNMSQTLQVFL
jgi:hypothetical protein